MKRYKVLYSITAKDLKEGPWFSRKDVNLSVVGIFESIGGLWVYYAVSYINGFWGKKITDELTVSAFTFDYFDVRSIEKHKKFSDFDKAKNFIDEFKIKWETGSNNVLMEKRDQKIESIFYP